MNFFESLTLHEWVELAGSIYLLAVLLVSFLTKDHIYGLLLSSFVALVLGGVQVGITAGQTYIYEVLNPDGLQWYDQNGQPVWGEVYTTPLHWKVWTGLMGWTDYRWFAAAVLLLIVAAALALREHRRQAADGVTRIRTPYGPYDVKEHDNQRYTLRG